MKHMFFIIVLFLAPLLVAHAYIASSSNYRLQSDSVNNAGALSTSTGYRLEDTTGEIGTGVGTSTTYQTKAGYQQMQESGLALVVPGTITLAPNIPATGGGIANGQGTWTVRTDNPAGYTMTIRASNAPALVSGVNSFADYTLAGVPPDFTFTVAAAAGEFGFSPEGTDIVSRYLDNGATCNVGSGDTSDRCWDPLLTSERLIAQRNSANHPVGSDVTVKFRAESGASNVVPAGSYAATTTITVLAR